jgi:hypothetical protein
MFCMIKNLPMNVILGLLNPIQPVTVAERSKACTVFARSEAGIVSSDLFPVRYELNSYILFLYTAGHGSLAV